MMSSLLVLSIIVYRYVQSAKNSVKLLYILILKHMDRRILLVPAYDVWTLEATFATYILNDVVIEI